MEPTDNNSGLSLPPVFEDIPDAKDSKSGSVKELAPINANIPIPAPDSSPILTDQTSSIIPAPTSTVTNYQADHDLIDKDWVNRAKSIVIKYKNDPYKLSEKLTLLKADYMKKRFNKTLKLSD